MEDDNGLDLSLSLPCGGGSSSIAKAKSGSSSDTRTDEGDRGSKLIENFKSFLDGGTQILGSSQRSDPPKPDENFFNNLNKAVVDVDASTNLNNGGFWNANNERSTEVEEGKRSEVGYKRKSLFEEINQQKKREREAHHADLNDKARASHISITTDDGSTAENEDVADSEADGSTSRLVSQRHDPSKRYSGGVSLSEVPKDVGISDSSGVDLRGQKMFTIPSDKEFKFGSMPYGVPFPAQSANVLSVPYSLPMKETNPIVAPNTSSYPLPGMMQVIAAANGERPGAQPVMPANMPLMFSYSPIQLPALDMDNSRGLVSHSPQLHPAYAGRGPSISDKQNDGLMISQAAMPVIPHKPSDTMQHDGRVSERAKSDGKQHATEEGISSRIEDDVRGSNMIFRAKDASDQPKTEGFPFEYPSIRPGIAADLKFGGSGSYPNLPWVSTTGHGPNGRTICGVTYKYSATQIRIVCACHGSHMSPEEFIQHASEEQTKPDADTGLASFPSSNPAASAQT